jgi:hypothetical protein
VNGFDGFLANLKAKLADLLAETIKSRRDAAAKDVESFLQESRADLERWTRLLAQGDLSPEEFEWLVKARLDLAKMAALEQAGLAKVAMDRFKKALLGILIGSALEVFK